MLRKRFAPKGLFILAASAGVLLAFATAVFSADIPIATVPTGDSPNAVAIDPVLNRIWVANFYGDSVTVIDGVSDTVATTVPMPGGPSIAVPNAVVIDALATPPKAYVANWQSHKVSIVNASTYAKIATITVPTANLGNPRALALNPSSNPPKLYVANYHRNNVSVLNATTGALIKEIPVGASPRGLAIFVTNPRERIFVANRFSNNVTVIDGKTDSVVATLPTGAGPKSIAIEPNTGHAFVSSPASDTVTVIDDADAVVATLTVGDNPVGLGVEPARRYLFVANYLSNDISVFDSRSYARLATISAGPGPWAVGIDRGDRKAFITNYRGSSVTIVDRFLVSTSCTTGAGPYAIASNEVVNPHKAYSANWTSDTVTVIDEPIAGAPIGAPQAIAEGGPLALTPAEGAPLAEEPDPVAVSVDPFAGGSTPQARPVIKGTARSSRAPYPANILAVFVSIDGGALQRATITSGAGSPDAGWEYQPATDLSLGTHTVRAIAFDQMSAASANSGQDQVGVQSGPAGAGSYSFSVVSGPPFVTSITPVFGAPGTTVTINGSGFGTQQGSGWVTFWGGLRATSVSWSDTQVQALVPVGAVSGYIGVVQNGIVSNGKWFNPYDRPQVDSIAPNFGAPGTTVTIAGSRFLPTRGSGWVTFGGVSGPVVSWSDSSVVARVPTAAVPSYAGIVQNGLTSNGKWFIPYDRPYVKSVSPGWGAPGETITITGSGFGSARGSGRTTFWGVSGPIVSWSDTEVVTLVPAGATSGYCGVVQYGLTSNGKWFTVLSAPLSYSAQDMRVRTPKKAGTGFSAGSRTQGAPAPLSRR